MDRERALSFASQLREIRDRVKNLEPLNPDERLSPQEKYAAIAERMNELARKEEEYGGSRTKSSNWNIDDDVTLELSTTYDFSYGRKPSLPYVIEATWRTDEVPRFLGNEQVWFDDLEKDDTPRVLGLLYESLIVAENIHTQQLLAEFPSANH